MLIWTFAAVTGEASERILNKKFGTASSVHLIKFRETEKQGERLNQSERGQAAFHKDRLYETQFLESQSLESKPFVRAVHDEVQTFWLYSPKNLQPLKGVQRMKKDGRFIKLNNRSNKIGRQMKSN